MSERWAFEGVHTAGGTRFYYWERQTTSPGPWKYAWEVHDYKKKTLKGAGDE